MDQMCLYENREDSDCVSDIYALKQELVTKASETQNLEIGNYSQHYVMLTNYSSQSAISNDTIEASTTMKSAVVKYANAYRFGFKLLEALIVNSWANERPSINKIVHMKLDSSTNYLLGFEYPHSSQTLAVDTEIAIFSLHCEGQSGSTDHKSNLVEFTSESSTEYLLYVRNQKVTNTSDESGKLL